MADLVNPAELFKALGDEHRLKILNFITTANPACCSTRRGICACDVIEATGLAQATVSHHMKILTKARLITAEKRGRWVYYNLNQEGFRQAQALLQTYLDSARKQVPLEVLA
jgi:ArsR family transcriptional regulator, arsenate/arsenite/antimonite-responsive transcriptional repressor